MMWADSDGVSLAARPFLRLPAIMLLRVFNSSGTTMAGIVGNGVARRHAPPVGERNHPNLPREAMGFDGGSIHPTRLRLFRVLGGRWSFQGLSASFRFQHWP